MIEENRSGTTIFTDPPAVRVLFGSTRWAWLWLVVRLYIGYNWIDASSAKLGNPAWMQTGTALKGFWTAAVASQPGGHAPIAFQWYRLFIESLLASGAYIWFAKVIAFGELLVGIALVLGVFTGIAAFIGGFMNWNFMMAGTASINPVLFTLSILLLLAWKNAGWLGLDRWLLPALGTPWKPGRLFARAPQAPPPV